MKQTRSNKLLVWFVRFTKFNLIGLIPFIMATILYIILYNSFGFWTWFIANTIGAFFHFGLIEFFNKKKIGFMFKEPKSEEAERQ